MNKQTLKKKYLQTSFGNIAYLETGSYNNPPVLFVHGIPTSSYLWRHVLELLQDDFHCYAPDLMGLGDTEVDPDSDNFHMNAQAEMLLEFMASLGHDHFCAVCHDQGGAAVQIIAAQYSEKIKCLVITDCVCYDNWPVPRIKKLQTLIRRVPTLAFILTKIGFFEWGETKTRFSNFRQAVFDPDRLSNEAIREYLRPGRSCWKNFNRFKKFLLAGDSKYTMKAIPGLKKFNKPTMIIWAADDHELSLSWGKKLFDEIPGADRFELIPFCGHFWQEEKPGEFVFIIREFLTDNCK